MSDKTQSGVDIDLGNQCSRTAYSWAKKTFSHREQGEGNPKLDVEGSFSNVMDYHGVMVGMSSDGIGTKIELAERTEIYSTLGYDLIAMTADDMAANGMDTVNMTNILDVDHLDHAIIDKLMNGLYEAAKASNIIITGGEIAELGGRICGYGDNMHFNWCAAGVSLMPEGLSAVDGSSIEPGDTVIALKSRGFRSNGFSLIRRIMENAFGDTWHEKIYNSESNPEFNGRTWGEILITPSIIFSPLITHLRKEGFNLEGICHVTGGGLGDNFARVLKVSGHGAVMDNIFPPLPFMKELQSVGNITEEQAYRLWNMGNGMLLVCRPDSADSVVSRCKEKGFEARICGRIIPEPLITISSCSNDPKELSYEAKAL